MCGGPRAGSLLHLGPPCLAGLACSPGCPACNVACLQHALCLWSARRPACPGSPTPRPARMWPCRSLTRGRCFTTTFRARWQTLRCAGAGEPARRCRSQVRRQWEARHAGAYHQRSSPGASCTAGQCDATAQADSRPARSRFPWALPWLALPLQVKTRRRGGAGSVKTLENFIHYHRTAKGVCTVAVPLGQALAARYDLSRHVPPRCLDTERRRRLALRKRKRRRRRRAT